MQLLTFINQNQQRMKKHYLLLIIILFVGLSTNTYAQCISCSLNGSNSIQRGSTTTYSTTYQSGSNYFWSVTGGLQLMSGNTGTSVTVKAVSGTSGKVTVVRYGNGKTPCSFVKNITITDPAGCTLNSVSVTQLSGSCNSTTFSYRATPNGTSLTGVTYNWEALGTDVSIISGQGTNTVTIRANTTPIDFIGARVNVTACGVTRTGARGELCEEPCGDFFCRIATFPNPSHGGFSLIVNKGQKSSTFRTAQDFTVQVLNRQGKVVKEFKTSKTDVFVDTAELENGLHFVRVIHASGESQTESVLINN